MKITIVGAYGCGNVGDEALLEGIITKIKAYEPNAEIEVFALDQLYIQKMFSVNTVSQVLTRGLTWRVIKGFDFLGIIRSLYSSNAIIIGGGSLIHERTIYNLFYYYCLALWAKLSGSKVYFVGLSISTIQSYLGRRIAKRLFSFGELITVRDVKSFQNINALDISNKYYLSWDLAFINLESDLTSHCLKSLELPDQFIGVNVCGWFQSEEYWTPNEQLQNKRIIEMAVLIDRLIETYEDNIVFINTVASQDSGVCYEIFKHVKAKPFVTIIHETLSPYEMKQVISQASFLIGMRLHSLVFSTIMGTPYVAFNYDEKIKAFVDRLDIEELHVLDIEDLNKTNHVLDVIKNTRNKHEIIQVKLREVTKQFHQNLWKEDWNI
jgi:polysaccharide pyruvyl transferase CsaB